MKRFLYLLALSFSYFSLAAQSHEWDQWRFPDSCSVSFTGGVPANVTPAAISPQTGSGAEGCASIADRNGHLLCYTSGVTLWDKNGNPTPNGTGLKGDVSTTQAALILPLPGDTNIYYIFTASPFEVHCDSGYRYSIYDRRLNGGLGDITATKNVLLYAPSSEMLAATHNARHTAYWIATRSTLGDSLAMYGLSDTGLSGPIYSRIGQDSMYYRGASFAPDGRRMALCSGGGTFLLCDVDPLTGAVSGAITLHTGTYGNENNYFTCFSPDGSLLYVTEPYHGALYQYDVSSHDSATIAASRYQLARTNNSYGGGNMEQGPDGKIYVECYAQDYLGAITYPDVPGAGCGYVPNAFYLGGHKTMGGLPAIVCSAFAPPLCTTTTTPINGAICVDVPYIFHGRSLSSPGIYRDTFQTYYGCDSIIVLNLTIQQAPPVMLSLRPLVQRGSLHVSDADTFVCAGDPSFLLTGGYPLGGSYSGAAVTGSRFTPPAISGTSAISYTYTDTTGCAALSRKVIQVRDCTTGIDDLTAASAISVYPEPSAGIFTLHTSLTPDSYYLIRDLSGRIIAHSAIAQEGQRIDLSDKASGTYLLTVVSDERAETMKVTVVK